MCQTIELNVLEFTFLVWAGSLAAGFLGALTGLGGGVVLVPLLTLFFHVDLRYAIGASLVSVIATSSGSAAAYVKEGFSNIRIGMFLEIATTLGALAGRTSRHANSHRRDRYRFRRGADLLGLRFVAHIPAPDSDHPRPPDPLATKLKLNGTFPTPDGIRALQCLSRAARVQPDVRRGSALRDCWGSVRAR